MPEDEKKEPKIVLSMDEVRLAPVESEPLSSTRNQRRRVNAAFKRVLKRHRKKAIK